MHISKVTSLVLFLVGAVPIEETAKEIDRVIESTKERSLRFGPGTKYEYSNFNYCLLGYIAEKITGETYPGFMKKYVLDRVPMNHTTYDDPRTIIKSRAQGYVAKQGILLNDKPTDPAAYAAGGLLSNTEDLFLFDRALYSGKLLSAHDVSIMLTPLKENYGYGWQIAKHFDRKVFNHRGETHGFSSYVARFPNEDNLFIAVISNIENQSSRGVGCGIEALYFNSSWNSDFQSKPDDVSDLKNYVGEFQMTTGDTRTVIAHDSSLYYKGGNSEYKLLRVSINEFAREDYPEIHLKFVRNNDGSLQIQQSLCGQEQASGNKR